MARLLGICQYNFSESQSFSDQGATVEAKLSSTNYKRLPLIQGALEIPWYVIVTMPGTIDNQLILEKD